MVEIMIYSEYIKQYRKANHLTQAEFGSRFGVSKQTVSNWENKDGIISRDHIFKLKEFFGISYEEIYQSTDLSSRNIKTHKEDTFCLGLKSMYSFIKDKYTLHKFLRLFNSVAMHNNSPLSYKGFLIYDDNFRKDMYSYDIRIKSFRLRKNEIEITTEHNKHVIYIDEIISFKTTELPYNDIFLITIIPALHNHMHDFSFAKIMLTTKGFSDNLYEEILLFDKEESVSACNKLREKDYNDNPRELIDKKRFFKPQPLKQESRHILRHRLFLSLKGFDERPIYIMDEYFKEIRDFEDDVFSPNLKLRSSLVKYHRAFNDYQGQYQMLYFERAIMNKPKKYKYVRPANAAYPSTKQLLYSQDSQLEKKQKRPLK